MNELLKSKEYITVDTTLSISTAEKKGYKYVSDIPNLLQIIIELLDLAEKRGYKLGLSGKPQDKMLGLYRKANTNGVDS